MSHLDDLFAPIGLAGFLAEHWERAPWVLRAKADDASPLLTHAALIDALTFADEVPEGVLAFPEQLDPGLDMRALVGAPVLLDAYFAAGHPLVWSRARGVFPAVDALSDALSVSFGARVWPNVYATGTAGTPFDAHFDAHEVIAVQCEGRKRWWFSEVRVDRPLDVGAMEPAIAHALRSRRDEALARPLREEVVGPGDRVYVPRGQFHNAFTDAGRSLHVTFGIRLPTGWEALEQLVGELLGDPALREYFPPRAADPDGSRAEAMVEALAATIRGRVSPEALGEQVGQVRAALIGRARRPAE